MYIELSPEKKNKTLRENEFNLLISFFKPHKSVKPCTAVGCLKNMLKEAGIDTEVFKPQSTRGAFTSKANKFGLSLQQIMNKANWKSANTFQRFYNKPIQVDNDQFAQKVLQM